MIALRHWNATARRLWYLHTFIYAPAIACWFMAWFGPQTGGDRRAFGLAAGIMMTVAFVLGFVAWANRSE